VADVAISELAFEQMAILTLRGIPARRGSIHQSVALGLRTGALGQKNSGFQPLFFMRRNQLN